MAINNYPGVGPQNSDIANTIAVTPAVSSQIAANVPSTSAIATAVAAAVPTRANIQSDIQTYAASAGVTNASITSAITTNAASAGVTMAAITSTVQANAGSPFGGTWTNLGTVTPSGNTTTISGLGSYKYLKFVWQGSAVSSYQWRIQINGDTGSNYFYNGMYYDFSNSNTGNSHYQVRTQTQLYLHYNNNATGGQLAQGDITIYNAQGGSYKYIETDTCYINTNRYRETTKAVWLSTAGVSSVTFLSGASNFTNSVIQVFGAN